MQACLSRRCYAEFLSTFCLVLIGCGAMAVDAHTEALTHVGVATVWGLIVMTMIYTVGDISGAHMNPAVTIAFVACRRLPATDAAGYVLSQLFGAIAGAAAIAAVVPVNEALHGTTTLSIPVGAGFAVELMMSAVLMFVVLGVSTGAKEKTITAGLAVGATIAMEAFVAGPLTKASMNPARSLGPALVAGHLTHLWVYIAAPIAGTLVGGLAYGALRPGGGLLGDPETEFGTVPQKDASE